VEAFTTHPYPQLHKVEAQMSGLHDDPAMKHAYGWADTPCAPYFRGNLRPLPAPSQAEVAYRTLLERLIDAVHQDHGTCRKHHGLTTSAMHAMDILATAAAKNAN
jgi:hypothetical protein